MSSLKRSPEEIQSKPSGKKISKKRKRSSPFRIKIGCVVALRYRPGGNHVTLETSEGFSLVDQITTANDNLSSFSELWADPQPGRDEGLALLGSRVRCCFPKIVLSEKFHKRATSRILEGEIVSIVDYPNQIKRQKESRRRREAHGTKVDLLIDKNRLEALPFLKRQDADVDFSQLSESAKRAHSNEQRVKGENKVIVQVVLSDSSGIIINKNTTGIEARWVIRKRVPTKKLVSYMSHDSVAKVDALDVPRTSLKEAAESATNAGDSVVPTNGEQGPSDDTGVTTGDLNGNGNRDNSMSKPPKRKRRVVTTKEFSAPRYLGNGNDSRNQQEANWRWQAGKYNPLSFLKEAIVTDTLIERLSYNVLGEVIKIQPASPPSSTIAMVTIKRLVLPEHTESGRMSHHGANEIFEDFDSNLASTGALSNAGKTQDFLYKVPVEELVIVNKKLNRTFKIPSHEGPIDEDLYVNRSYSLRYDKFLQLSDENTNFNETECKNSDLCPRCRCKKRRGETTNGTSHWRCESCVGALEAFFQGQAERLCDCLNCQNNANTERQSQLFYSTNKASGTIDSTLQSLEKHCVDQAGFVATRLLVNCMSRVDFSASHNFPPPTMPSSKLIVRVKKSRSPKKTRKLISKLPVVVSDTLKGMDKKEGEGRSIHNPSATQHSYQHTCSRLVPYNIRIRRFEVSTDELCPSIESSRIGEKPRNLRLTTHDQCGTGEVDREDKSNSRAARANQRRLLRGVAAIGVTFDALAGREQQLRFDRSSIHAWGVFADEDIREGEMLVEYRGEIIENSMAEKREKEYEDAKIGSDYMFRIDGLSVCDATKQGNVARFINASCDPNCFTKIISIDGIKRIVVYAKRDIPAGEELCYDYKFPLEYDEAKRIPCHCGARDCREFMNWVSISNHPILVFPLDSL